MLFLTSIPALPDLLAVFCAWTSIAGAAVGVVVGKASTKRRLFEDIALGATAGGVVGCVVVFCLYPFIQTLGT